MATRPLPFTIHGTLELMKQYIEGTPPRDDSCGPIAWHVLDDKGPAAFELDRDNP